MKCSSARTGCLQAAKFSKAKSSIESGLSGDGAEAVSYRQSAESEPSRSGGVAVGHRMMWRFHHNVRGRPVGCPPQALKADPSEAGGKSGA